jgi:hypothetical protein
MWPVAPVVGAGTCGWRRRTTTCRGARRGAQSCLRGTRASMTGGPFLFIARIEGTSVAERASRRGGVRVAARAANRAGNGEPAGGAGLVGRASGTAAWRGWAPLGRERHLPLTAGRLQGWATMLEARGGSFNEEMVTRRGAACLARNEFARGIRTAKRQAATATRNPQPQPATATATRPQSPRSKRRRHSRRRHASSAYETAASSTRRSPGHPKPTNRAPRPK